MKTPALVRRLARLWIAATTAVTAVYLGGCSSHCTNSIYCGLPLEITANVPDIGNATWTVQVCRNTDCRSTSLRRSVTRATIPPQTSLELQQQGSQWQLFMDSATWYQEGDAWSLEVVDDQGHVVVKGHGTVHFQYPPSVCDSCGYDSVTIK